MEWFLSTTKTQFRKPKTIYLNYFLMTENRTNINFPNKDFVIGKYISHVSLSGANIRKHDFAMHRLFIYKRFLLLLWTKKYKKNGECNAFLVNDFSHISAVELERQLSVESTPLHLPQVIIRKLLFSGSIILFFFHYYL